MSKNSYPWYTCHINSIDTILKFKYRNSSSKNIVVIPVTAKIYLWTSQKKLTENTHQANSYLKIKIECLGFYLIVFLAFN